MTGNFSYLQLFLKATKRLIELGALLLLGTIAVAPIVQPLNQWVNEIIQHFEPWVEQYPEQVAILLVGVVIVYKLLDFCQTIVAERDRRNLYQQWAQAHHWSYYPEENRQLYQKYGFLLGIPGYANRASRTLKPYPCAIHQFKRQWRNYVAIAYTHYNYSKKVKHAGKRRRTTIRRFYLGVTLIHVNEHFPKLYLRPTNWLDSVFKHMSWPASTTEYLDDSMQTITQKSQGKQQLNEYQVTTTNPAFKEEFFNSELLQYFQENLGKFQLEVNQDVLVLYQEGRLNPEMIDQNLEHLHRIYQLIPQQWKQGDR